MPRNWTGEPCSVKDLAVFLHTRPLKPIVFLTGRAEIGPRALGHRSIIMNPGNLRAQEILNTIKKRELWRPVAPIALEDDATLMFSPGTSDPYMLFDHAVLTAARSKIPACVHIDGTARLQTVGKDGCPIMRELLQEFKQLSGLGVLCNTSANLNGSGFFPDVASAIAWNKVDRIWGEGILYRRLL